VGSPRISIWLDVTLRDLIGEESTDKGYPSRRETPAPKEPIHRQARGASWNVTKAPIAATW